MSTIFKPHARYFRMNLIEAAGLRSIPRLA